MPVVAQQTNLFACICSSKAYVIASDAAYVPADPTRGPSASCHCSPVQPSPCAACCSSSSCLPAHTCAPQHAHSGPGAAMMTTRRMPTSQAARTCCLLSRQSRLLPSPTFPKILTKIQRRPKTPQRAFLPDNLFFSRSQWILDFSDIAFDCEPVWPP